MTYLRELAVNADGKVAISGIRNHGDGPHFFAVQMLANGKLAIAPWAPNYISELQKSIQFGERGHSMVVDQNGHVVAHPNAEWQRISKDASKLSVVKAMITGNTWVMQFYSPPMDADMIAGFTFVPETGWGVMVPQPISELAARAMDVQSAALVIAAAEIFLAVLVSVWLSSLLAEPLLTIVGSARKLAGGDFKAHVGKLPYRTPAEIKQLAASFDQMVDEMAHTTAKLNRTLLRSEDVAQERAELLIAANQASEVKSRFVSMVSHELRTPLTSIKGSLELLDDGSNVEVELELFDNTAKISVRDKGIGISTKDKSRVFERFVQIESTDARRFGGSGLGLGIAKVIVEKHGGKIDFSSEKDIGSTFFFELPLKG